MRATQGDSIDKINNSYHSSAAYKDINDNKRVNLYMKAAFIVLMVMWTSFSNVWIPLIIGTNTLSSFEIAVELFKQIILISIAGIFFMYKCFEGKSGKETLDLI